MNMDLINRYIKQYEEDHDLFYDSKKDEDIARAELHDRIGKYEEPLLEQMSEEELHWLVRNQAHGFCEKMKYSNYIKRLKEKQMSPDNTRVVYNKY